MTVFDRWVNAVQVEVEADLGRLLPPQGSLPADLHAAMRYAVLGGGKRMRPLLVHAAGALFGAEAGALNRCAAALEMIHVYSLVHDDMPCMDDDALRRGKPTVHIAYDEATALLVGDALQAQAFLVLSDPALANPALVNPALGNVAHANPVPAARQVAMLHLLAQAAGSNGMCGGQAIDLASVGITLTLAQLEQMHQLKTGALLRAAVLLGAMCGKTLNDQEMRALDVYAAAIGLAFQVVDDMLDATADSGTLGKTAGKDAAANKPTYVSILGLEQSAILAEKLRTEAHLALDPFGENAARLRELADLIVQRKA
jgi:farnesyl diphosphate synthase